MHQYLRAIGFRKYDRKMFKEVLNRIIKNPDEKFLLGQGGDEDTFVQLESRCAENMGISVCGLYNEQGEFELEYYIPIFEGYEITTYEKPVIERHAAQESYSGLCDDFRIGIASIFFVSNAAE